MPCYNMLPLSHSRNTYSSYPYVSLRAFHKWLISVSIHFSIDHSIVLSTEILTTPYEAVHMQG